MALRKLVNLQAQGIPLNVRTPDGGEAVKVLPATHYVRKGAPVSWYKHEGTLLVDESEISPHIKLLCKQGSIKECDP